MDLETLNIAFETAGHAEAATQTRKLQQVVTSSVRRMNDSLRTTQANMKELGRDMRGATSDARGLSGALQHLATQSAKVQVSVTDLLEQSQQVRALSDDVERLDRQRADVGISVPSLASEIAQVEALSAALAQLNSPRRIDIDVSDAGIHAKRVEKLVRALSELKALGNVHNIQLNVTDVSKDAKHINTLARALKNLEPVARDRQIQIGLNDLTAESAAAKTLASALARLDRVGKDGNVRLSVEVGISEADILKAERLAAALKSLKMRDINVNLKDKEGGSKGSSRKDFVINSLYAAAAIGVAKSLANMGTEALKTSAKVTALSGAVVAGTAALGAYGTVAAGVAGGALAGTLAAASGAAMGLVTSIGLAGAGVGAFAALAAPSVIKVKDRFDEYTQAVEEARRATAAGDLAGYQEALDKQAAALGALTPLQRETVTNLQRTKDAFASTAEALEPQTLGLFNQGLGIAISLLPALRAVAEPVAGALSNVMASIGTGIQGDVFRDFVSMVAQDSPRYIEQFAEIGGNLFAGLVSGMQASSPLAAAVMDSLVTQSAKLEGAFASQGYQDFVNFSLQMLPELGELTGSVFGALTSLLSGLSPVAKPALDVLTQLFDSLDGVFSSSAMDAFAAKVVELLPLAGESLGQLGGAFGALMEAVSPLAGPVLTVIGSLGEALQGLFQSDAASGFIAGLSAALPQLVPVLTTLGEAFLGFLDVVVNQLVSSGALEALSTGLANLLPGFLTLAEAVLGAVLPVLAELLPPITELIGSLAGEGGLGGLVNLVGTALLGLAEAVGPLLPVLGELVTSLLEGLMPVFGELLETIVPVIGQLVEAFGPVIEEIAPILLDLATQLLEALGPVAEMLGKTLAETVIALAPILGDLAAMVLVLVEALLPLLPAILDIADAILKSAVPFLGMLIGALRPVIEIVAALIETLAMLVGVILGGVADALRKFAELMDLSGVTEKFQEMMQGVVDYISEFPDRLQEIFDNPEEWLTRIGADIVGGLIRGITSRIRDLVDTVRSIGESISDTLEWVLDIHSPSRVTAKIGAYAGQGVAVGLASTSKDIFEQAAHLGALIEDALDPADMWDPSQWDVDVNKALTVASGVYTIPQQASGSSLPAPAERVLVGAGAPNFRNININVGGRSRAELPDGSYEAGAYDGAAELLKALQDEFDRSGRGGNIG